MTNKKYNCKNCIYKYKCKDYVGEELEVFFGCVMFQQKTKEEEEHD